MNSKYIYLVTLCIGAIFVSRDRTNFTELTKASNEYDAHIPGNRTGLTEFIRSRLKSHPVAYMAYFSACPG